MTTSFYNGISGLMSFQNGIDIWGNNIANINTPGYKETKPEFATLFSKTLSINASPTSDIGLGSYLNSTAKDMSIGSFEQTDNRFDLAIGGEGWFAVKNGGETFYTRNGAFTRDMNGFLVNDNGEYLLVANANNLKVQNGEYFIDRNIDTTNLLPTNNLSPISLPDNVILPAVATKNVTLSSNLNDDSKIKTIKPATQDIDMSALYDKDGNDMKIRNSQSLVFGFGNKVDYEDGNLVSTFCFEDDEKDGKNVNIDFTLNNKEIKLTLPDGSSKEDIANAVKDTLINAGFIASAKNGELTIKTQNEFILKSNTPLIQSTAAAKLTYKTTPENDYDFSNFNDFTSEIQKLADIAYPGDIEVSFDNEGRLVVTNNSLLPANSYIDKTENSNDAFITNLGRAGNEIYPQTSNKSFTFNENQQQFGGYVIDNDGNKLPVTITFTKEKVLSNQILWKGDIKIKTPNGDINTTQNFIFDSNGELLSPKEVTFENINFKFDLTSYAKPDNPDAINYSFNQDGITKGYLQNYEIKDDGKIVGIFSNAQQAVLGQIPIFHFQNDQGLANIGGNDFTQTSNSGDAFLYTDKNGNYLPTKILSSTLETSNVNMSEAMTELIVTQKAFQASAKTVTTSDEMIQKAINLKR
ncbi:flagellar hook-basal body complex protein [Caminibacter sp.]